MVRCSKGPSALGQGLRAWASQGLGFVSHGLGFRVLGLGSTFRASVNRVLT